MGLGLNSTKFLLQARQSGVTFGETVTLGRQYMMLSPEKIALLLRQRGLWPPPEGEGKFLADLRGTKWRFEILARALGAKSAVSMDASSYEGATVIHDLNQPIPRELEESFDVVIDGGTLEHVFNFPVAIANCMKMLRTGGHLFLFTPANNFCGHGFYQFSPELFYRVLSPPNGFQVERMIALEDSMGRSSLLGVRYDFYIRGPWYEVKDPEQVGDRVPLLNHNEATLFVLAKKLSHGPVFKAAPQQSDYVPQWETQTAIPDPQRQTSFGRKVVDWLRSHLTEEFYREALPRLAFLADPFRLWRFRRSRSFKNRTCYRRVPS
jgi:SAM-dependent methyltransferase